MKELKEIADNLFNLILDLLNNRTFMLILFGIFIACAVNYSCHHESHSPYY